jgi:uncharacterized membrane protein
VIVIVCLIADKCPAAPATFTSLGLFGGSASRAFDVSADGSVVTGTVHNAGVTRVFRWTAAGAEVGPPIAPFPATPAISADGAVIVGQYNSPNGLEAFRWPAGGAFEGLGDFAGEPFDSRAIDVSDDGSVIVGYGSPTTNQEAFRWTQADGLSLLRMPPTTQGSSVATGVSDDGGVVVGLANGAFVFRWTTATGFVEFPFTSSPPPRVSGDGTVIVGTRGLPPPPGSIHSQKEAFRWTEAEGLVGLGNVRGGSPLATEAWGVSTDGSVIVGVDDTVAHLGPRNAFYWSASTGMVDLRSFLMANGATGLDNWQLIEVWAVSADGATIVGTGGHDGIAEAFIATIPEPGTFALAVVAAGIGAYLLCVRSRISS